MLLELTIRNVALIEALTIEFGPGFQVLTGETGAGKSIIVDSVNLVLGGRADRDLIRTGTEKAIVSALFDVSQNPAACRAAEGIASAPEDGMLLISREISRSGRNLCRVAGIPVPLNQLKQVTRHLIDVHGQHEHQQLIDPAMHLDYLDAHASDAQRECQARVAKAYMVRSETAATLKSKLRKSEETRRLSESLRGRIDDVTALRLKAGETEKLEKKLDLLENAERIRGNLQRAYQLSYGGSGSFAGAQAQLLQAAEALAELNSLSGHYAELEKRLRDAYYLAEDVGLELQKALDDVPQDTGLSAKISDRLESIYRLEKRYQMPIEELIASCKETQERLDNLETEDGEIAELKARYRKEDALLKEACEALTCARQELARNLETEILKHLAELGMEKTRFQIDIRPLPKPTASGMDEVEFLISANPGEPLKPLGSVASGGELSRVMLALKAVSAQGGVDSMVFDEIDTGVSGRIAQAVGEKLRMISKQGQVLCVTHLAQIAAMGSTHYFVEKKTVNGRTDSGVRKLSQSERVSEIARLLDGGANGKASQRLADDMLRHA